MPPITAAGVFPSEYYGSGEWATTAMATFHNLQQAMDQRGSVNPVSQLSYSYQAVVLS